MLIDREPGILHYVAYSSVFFEVKGTVTVNKHQGKQWLSHQIVVTQIWQPSGRCIELLMYILPNWIVTDCTLTAGGDFLNAVCHVASHVLCIKIRLSFFFFFKCSKCTTDHETWTAPQHLLQHPFDRSGSGMTCQVCIILMTKKKKKMPGGSLAWNLG